MNAACTAATPPVVAGVSSSTTPPLGNAASTPAHFRLGRTSRRSSSSGSSSSGNGGIVYGQSSGSVPTASVSQAKSAKRKRRRHSTLSSGVASGSEEEAERVPPMLRLRLGSYVSDFRLERARSHSPNSTQLYPATPSSPSSALRQRHQLRIHTTAVELSSSGNDHGCDQATMASVSFSPSSATSSSTPVRRDSDIEMDLDVQSTFQAMQVESPNASPSPTTVSKSNLTAVVPTIRASSTLPSATLQRPSPIPGNLLSPLVTDTRYPRSRSPLSPSYPYVSLVTYTSTSAVSPGVFPSANLVAARRNSRQSLGVQSQHHMPSSSSPLVRILSFDSNASSSAFSNANTHQHQNQNQHYFSHQHHHSPYQHLDASTNPFQQSFSQAAGSTGRSRCTSTPPSPIVAPHEEERMPSTTVSQIPPSLLRRHSDGRPSGLRPYAPV